MANISEEDSRINSWNTELSQTLIPSSVFLGICIVVGIIGNSLVILIYGLKLRGAKERYFIPILAVVDLLALCETAGFNISYNVSPVRFKGQQLCKWSWFFGYMTSVMSIFLLLVIAIQRYLKICRPFGKQMTLGWKRVAVLGTFIAAALISAPIPVTYGLDPVYSARYNVTGSACRRLTQENRWLSLIHAIVCNAIVAGVVWALIILYTLIGRKIHSQMQQWKHQRTNDNNVKMTNLNDGTSDTNSADRNKQTMFKITAMFMLISLIFILSFSPKVVIFILECVDSGFWDSLSNSNRLLVRFLDVLFVINNIANPFVYAFLDVKFSQQLKKIFCDLDYSL